MSFSDNSDLNGDGTDSGSERKQYLAAGPVKKSKNGSNLIIIHLLFTNYLYIQGRVCEQDEMSSRKVKDTSTSGQKTKSE